MKPLQFQRIGFISVVIGVIAIIPACSSLYSDSEIADAVKLVKRLPADEDFRPEPYLEAASKLQAMGKSKACRCLMEVAEGPKYGDQVFFLCRMLFVKRPSSEFRAPTLGLLSFYGETTLEDWPLMPIELVDDIPFRIIWGYQYYGAVHQPDEYLKYCMTNCNWSNVHFQPKSKDQVRAALNKLLHSQKWKHSLTERERDKITSQVE